MLPHPNLLFELARLRQAELTRQAELARLARAARRQPTQAGRNRHGPKGSTLTKSAWRTIARPSTRDRAA